MHRWPKCGRNVKSIKGIWLIFYFCVVVEQNFEFMSYLRYVKESEMMIAIDKKIIYFFINGIDVQYVDIEIVQWWRADAAVMSNICNVNFRTSTKMAIFFVPLLRLKNKYTNACTESKRTCESKQIVKI